MFYCCNVGHRGVRPRREQLLIGVGVAVGVNVGVGRGVNGPKARSVFLLYISPYSEGVGLHIVFELASQFSVCLLCLFICLFDFDLLF